MRVAFPLLLIVVPVLVYLRGLQQGWVAAAVELGVGLILLPVVVRSRTNFRFVVNSVTIALLAWAAALVVYLAIHPLE